MQRSASTFPQPLLTNTQGLLCAESFTGANVPRGRRDAAARPGNVRKQSGASCRAKPSQFPLPPAARGSNKPALEGQGLHKCLGVPSLIPVRVSAMTLPSVGTEMRKTRITPARPTPPAPLIQLEQELLETG